MTARAAGDAPFTRWVDGASTAASALEAGDASGALRASRAALAAVTTGEAGARAHLLVALALELDRQPAGAADQLAAALTSLPVTLLPAVRARRAASLAASGHPAAAAEAWALAVPGSDPADRPALAAAEARAWLAAGEPVEAARAAAAGGPDPGARLVLGRAWLALGDPRAAPALRTLALERAGEPEGEAAARALLATSPGALSVADRLERARRLLATTRTAAALAELDAVDAAVGDAPLITVMRAMAQLQSGRPSEAARIAAPVARLPGPGEPAAARYVLARAAARQGQIDEAVSLYRQVARERPVVPGLGPQQQADLADDAAFLAAWIPADAGRHVEVVQGLRRFLRERPGARRAPDARWFLAWSLLRSGDESAARNALRDVAARDTGNRRAAALYWQARIAPDASRAGPLYQEAAAEVPGGWYGLLSAARLEELSLPAPTPAPLPPSPLPDPPGDPRTVAALTLAVDLAAAGLREEAVLRLQRLSRAPDVRSRAALLAEAATFCGDPEVPYRMARDHLPAGIRAQRWAYPDAHREVLRPAARHLGVDPALALAVMRRESAFVPTARSGAAAEGLLQLRPETARKLGALAGIPDPADLARPVDNAPLGVAYLGLLLDRFSTPAQALSGYNAGPVAASAWSAARAGLPLDEWVEEIPYRETRDYVRGVTADWARYRTLSGEPRPPLDPGRPVRPAAPGVGF